MFDLLFGGAETKRKLRLIDSGVARLQSENARLNRHLDEIAGLVEKNPTKSAKIGAIQMVIADWRAGPQVNAEPKQ